MSSHVRRMQVSFAFSISISFLPSYHNAMQQVVQSLARSEVTKALIPMTTPNTRNKTRMKVSKKKPPGQSQRVSTDNNKNNMKGS